uniref:IgGFc-binding protein-like n=1 Tax=Crassostrea virginica TaxID=6565 RepID=A0A8B8C1R2_CRAVI|nr:IgGFc-binding protein-like [Crassostrea virginica]
MANHEVARGDVNAHILTEGKTFLNITSSPNLTNAIKSKVDRATNFTSDINIPFPNELSCKYLVKEPKGVLFTLSRPSTAIIFDSYDEGTTDGTLVIPTRKLSTEYLVSSVISGHQDHSQFAVGSLHGDTYINIKLNPNNNGTIMLLGQPLSSKNTFSTRLNQFETLQVKQDGDLSGTIVTANKPIAVFSGNRCKAFPGTGSHCSHMFSQLPPTQEYDNEYIIPPFYQNSGTLFQVISPVYSMVRITYGALSTWERFYPNVHQNFKLHSNESSVVMSIHPVQVTGFAMGSSTHDPYMTVIPGIHHYLDYYKIVVPENFRDNFISVIIPKHSLGNLKINDLPISSFTTVFHSQERSSGITYNIHTLSVPHGVYVLKTTDRIRFGLLVYGHSRINGYGYAGNFVLP